MFSFFRAGNFTSLALQSLNQIVLWKITFPFTVLSVDQCWEPGVYSSIPHMCMKLGVMPAWDVCTLHVIISSHNLYLSGVLQLDFHFVLFASCKFVGGSLERFASQWAEIRVSCFSQQGFLKPANWLLLKPPSEWFWFREGPLQESNLGDLHSQERVTLAEAFMWI